MMCTYMTCYWIIVEVMQLDDGRSSDPPYLFQRLTSEPLDSLIVRGRGPASRPNGLSRSLFRPSDDAVTLPYNIPGNAMACVELNHVQELILVLISMVKIDFEQLNRLFLVSLPQRRHVLIANRMLTHVLVHVRSSCVSAFCRRPVRGGAEAGSVACSPAGVVLGSTRDDCDVEGSMETMVVYKR
jgi:hypothetical protein